MTSHKILLPAVLCLIPALAISQSDPTSTIDGGPTPPTLQEILQLTPEQAARIEQIDLEYDDARFLHFQEAFAQVWELLRVFRTAEPNVTHAESLYAQVMQTIEEGRKLDTDHRTKIRAVLTPRQQFALYSLEQALKLSHAANEALNENMIEDPFDIPSIEDAFDFVNDGWLVGID